MRVCELLIEAANIVVIII